MYYEYSMRKNINNVFNVERDNLFGFLKYILELSTRMQFYCHFLQAASMQ